MRYGPLETNKGANKKSQIIGVFVAARYLWENTD